MQLMIFSLSQSLQIISEVIRVCTLQLPVLLAFWTGLCWKLSELKRKSWTLDGSDFWMIFEYYKRCLVTIRRLSFEGLIALRKLGVCVPAARSLHGGFLPSDNKLARSDQGTLNGKVSLYNRPPVW